MYGVSNRYKAEMKAPLQEFDISGTIGNAHFTSKNIVQGTFTITNQCTDDSAITVGSVYIGQLSATFTGVNVNRYKWNKKVITPIHYRVYEDGSFEGVPLGVYTVSEAIWSADGMSVTAYDNMAKFDKNFRQIGGATSGSPYDVLRFACVQCDVELGMTEAQVRALPNGTDSFVLPADNDIQTYRDLISYMAACLAAYATIDRVGRLVLRTFNQTVVDEIAADARFQGATFEDFETHFTAVHMTKDGEIVREGMDENDGLDMDLGANPFLQGGNPHRRLEYILMSLLNVQYVPFTVQMIGDPAYDLGDVIRLTDGIGDGDKLFCITRYMYTFNGAYEAAGAGERPSSMTKQDKELAAMAQTTSQNEIQYYTFWNFRETRVGEDTTKEIINLRFAAINSTKVMFQAEIHLDARANPDVAIGSASYRWNENDIDGWHPTETWVDGNHVLHLLYVIDVEAQSLNRWKVFLTADRGDMIIYGAHAVISGQGLVATDSWDGLIEVSDEFNTIPLATTPTPVAHSAYVVIDRHVPHWISVIDNMGHITLSTTPTPQTFIEALYLNKDRLSSLLWQEVKEMSWGETIERYNW